MKILKHVFPVLLGASLLAATTVQSATPPLVRLTLRNYGDLTNAIIRVVSTASPDKGGEAVDKLQAELGLTNLAGLNLSQPWEIAAWYAGAGQPPLVALKLPVADVAKFKAGLSEEGLLRAQGHEWSQLSNGLSAVIFRDEDSLSDSDKAALDEWKTAAVPAPARLVELTLTMSESFRSQAQAGLGFGRMMVGQAVSAQSAQHGGAAGAEASQAILGVYFDVLDKIVAGLQDYRLGVDLAADAVTLEGSIGAKAGTELAGWLHKPSDHVSPDDLKWLDPNAAFSFAGYISKDPALIKLVQKVMSTSLQLQGVETNSAALKNLNTLLEKSLPMVVAGSADFKEKLTAGFAYRFPAGNASELYGQAKQFLTNDFLAFVGKDKLYSASSLAEKDHTVKGVAVDRLSLTLNLDSPLLQAPGQKENLQAIWPEGKFVFDYAVKDNHLFGATGDRMNALFEAAEAKSAKESAFTLGEGTLAVGYFNIPRMMKGFTTLGVIPAEAKEKMAKLDAEGTAIEFQLRLEDRLSSSARIPLKLIHQLGSLGED